MTKNITGFLAKTTLRSFFCVRFLRWRGQLCRITNLNITTDNSVSMRYEKINGGKDITRSVA